MSGKARHSRFPVTLQDNSLEMPLVNSALFDMKKSRSDGIDEYTVSRNAAATRPTLVRDMAQERSSSCNPVRLNRG